MLKCILLRGCPGADKTTYYYDFLHNNKEFYGYSTDGITHILFGWTDGYWAKKGYNKPGFFDYQDRMLEVFFDVSTKYKRNIIVDSLNYDMGIYDLFVKIAKQNNVFEEYEIEWKDFDVPLKELLKRNDWRKTHDPEFANDKTRIINEYYIYQKILRDNNKK